ncbi:hypothetical protein CPLU01_03804 [Colletotrichum plurivorum]|uniref:Uncharacterized protein n=1 Tax=Colletotrichum plurivorum TaxID=2175906 RepID=A0A8H6KSU8_9PEZI|nr:hypothetical protein CPLU01_03804 [Colletotrichum plurivorum]
MSAMPKSDIVDAQSGWESAVHRSVWLASHFGGPKPILRSFRQDAPARAGGRPLPSVSRLRSEDWIPSCTKPMAGTNSEPAQLTPELGCAASFLALFSGSKAVSPATQRRRRPRAFWG